MKVLFVVVAGLMLCCAAAIGLDGKWQGSVKLADGNVYPITYEFKVAGDSLTGTGQSQGGPKDIEAGKIKGNDFSFRLTGDEGGAILHSGKYYPVGDSISLMVIYQGDTLHATLMRAKNPQ